MLKAKFTAQRVYYCCAVFMQLAFRLVKAVHCVEK